MISQEVLGSIWEFVEGVAVEGSWRRQKLGAATDICAQYSRDAKYPTVPAIISQQILSKNASRSPCSEIWSQRLEQLEEPAGSCLPEKKLCGRNTGFSWSGSSGLL